MGTATQPRRYRSDGQRSRTAILDAAVSLAATEGLDGISIGRLAEHAGISKSGLYAHFGSKEELQLATIHVALDRHQREILQPALAAPDPVARLTALCENFLAYVGRNANAGGCFFASVSAEFDTRPGAVRDLLVESQTAWMTELTNQYAQAQAAGLLNDSADPAQGAFELNAYLHLANDQFVLFRDPAYLDRARRSVADHLERHRPDA